MIEYVQNNILLIIRALFSPQDLQLNSILNQGWEVVFSFDAKPNKGMIKISWSETISKVQYQKIGNTLSIDFEDIFDYPDFDSVQDFKQLDLEQTIKRIFQGLFYYMFKLKRTLITITENEFKVNIFKVIFPTTFVQEVSVDTGKNKYKIFDFTKDFLFNFAFLLSPPQPSIFVYSDVYQTNC